MSVQEAALDKAPARLGGRTRVALDSPILLKAVAGIALLLLWEGVVRALAPGYVAKPTGIAAVFARVVGDAEFLAAAWATLS